MFSCPARSDDAPDLSISANDGCLSKSLKPLHLMSLFFVHFLIGFHGSVSDTNRCPVDRTVELSR